MRFLSLFLIPALLLCLVGRAEADELYSLSEEVEAQAELLIAGNGDENLPSDPSEFAFEFTSVELTSREGSLFAQAEAYLRDHAGEFPNRNFVAVIDFSRHSRENRFFVKNLATGSVEALPVAHGKGSDTDNDGYAERFSNVPNSRASSLGFYRTAETYYGKNGYSLRLDGLSSTNSNARQRAVVLHGSNYVSIGRSKQGRSYGCPAIPMRDRDRMIAKLKGGALIFAAN